MDAAMKEDLELIKLRLTKGPSFCSPEEQVHLNGSEEQIFVVDVKVRVTPYFL
jgi:hypothetical protein